MPLDLDLDYSLAAQQLKAMSPFIWLFELGDPANAAQRYRYTNFTQQVPWGEDSLGNPHIYYPAQIVTSPIRHDGDQGLPTIDIGIGLGGPVASTIVDAANGFTGQPFLIHLVNSVNLAASSTAATEEGEVVGADISTDGIGLRVAAGSLFESDFPSAVYSRSGCVKWFGDFGGEGCGYNLNAPGAGFEGCGIRSGGLSVAPPFTLEACTLVGDDEEANPSVGQRQHPARFGGFPSLRSSR